jgi:hypothetical protein
MENKERAAGRKASQAFRSQAAKTTSQTGSTADKNADLMAAVLTNSDRDQEVSSLVGNPAEAQELERWDVLENVVARATVTATAAGESTQNELMPALTALTGRGLTPVDTLKVIPLVNLDIATINAKLGPLTVNGWVLDKIAEPMGLIAKAISYHAETVINSEAPTITLTASATMGLKASLLATRSDVLWDVTRDYIGRISNTFFVEAAQFVALGQNKLRLESNSKIELAAGNTAPGAGIELDSSGKIDISGSSLTLSSTVSHTISANTSVTISSTIINLNPTVPVAPSIGPIVLPITPIVITPNSETGQGKTPRAGLVPKYQGQLGSGVVLI